MPFECTPNLVKNQELIINTIAHAYETGLLEDPAYTYMLSSILSLLCEAKVQGSFGEDLTTGPSWQLTPEYEEELQKHREALASKNVVIGPWQQSGL
tara:strand:- start:119 stop:409 length:291 start_codon:yes stop_codon:yes gene_type:complete